MELPIHFAYRVSSVPIAFSFSHRTNAQHIHQVREWSSHVFASTQLNKLRSICRYKCTHTLTCMHMCTQGMLQSQSDTSMHMCMQGMWESAKCAILSVTQPQPMPAYTLPMPAYTQQQRDSHNQCLHTHTPAYTTNACIHAPTHTRTPALQEKRESQLQQLQDVLYSAWEALGIREGVAERAALARSLIGPERLHASTKDMVGPVCAR
jgi:hypothetical protein